MPLTGEWLPAKKKGETLAKETDLADRDNMVYMGTTIEEGKGKMVVTATGISAEIGEVAEMVREAKEEKTPFQKRLANFSKLIGLVITFIALFIFIEGLLTGNTFLEMFTMAVAVAVAAIPEGLPVALTVILALGMQRILKKQGLVRKLLAAETLGSTSIIATDKTCTLTEGRMALAEVFYLDKRKKKQGLILKIAALTNEAFIENPQAKPKDWQVRGRPTDRALLLAGIEAGFNRESIEKEEEVIYEMPFDPVRKYAATFTRGIRKKERVNIYLVGAPEVLLGFSKIKPAGLKQVEGQLADLTKKGYRVVGVAFKEIRNKKQKFNKLEERVKDIHFLGLIALHDPLRRDAKEAIHLCIQAGMRPIIVTGDHKLTARAIAQELGLPCKEKNLVQGQDLEQMTEKEFDKRLKEITVYARVEPKHKIRIVEAWQKKGEVVAMTGDGINDAPALKRADIGVALGSGTEVAKETSDLILLNDSFSIILAAVEEGRAILDNIRKVITYLLSDSFSEVILVGTALLAGFPLPISPVQILWVNLIEDGLPDIALAFESKEKDLMKQKPRKHNTSLLTQEMKAIIFIIGLITDLILLGLFFWLWQKNHDISYVRTMIFACLAIDSLFYVFSCKSLRRNLWHINPLSNRFLTVAVGVGFLMLFLAIYLPALQTLLKTVPLYLNDWLIILALGIIELILIEATKWYFIGKKKIA